MADGVKISLLPGAGTISDADVVAGVQNGSTKKFSFAGIFAWLKAKLTPGEIGAQEEITAIGILKGDGAGGVSAAVEGEDYQGPLVPEVDYATPNQIPVVPGRYAGNPAMDGAASPGTSAQWADGGHVHPTDTTRAAAALEINGHPLTGDFDLTAADVGALASGGTATAANALAARHTISGASGWYKFLSVPIDASRSRDIWLLINTGYNLTERAGILAIHAFGTSQNYVNFDVAHMPRDWVRWETVTEGGQTYLVLYVYKDSGSSGQMQFYVLYATSHISTVLTNLVWSSDGPTASPPTTATAATANTFQDADRQLWFSTVAVSAGTAQQILSISDASITADHVLAEITFADPAYITGGGSWASAAGSFTLTGTCEAATTADVLLVRKGN